MNANAIPNRDVDRRLGVAVLLAAIVGLLPIAAWAQPIGQNEPGIVEPVSTEINIRNGVLDPIVRMPNTDQSVDGVEQSLIFGEAIRRDGLTETSMLGHPITRISSPNDDLRDALQAMVLASGALDQAALEIAADELMAILLGTTQGRMYDGFSMLNFNRWNEPSLGAQHFPPDAVVDEYKMKVARDSGETFTSPFDGERRRIWEVDVNMLYYDGQIDSDTFLLRFPFGHHDDDTLRIHYRIFALAQEDFSPTLVTLDKRMALNTVQFPFKGMDSVWVAFERGEVLELTVKYPPLRQLRGIYTWGWRQHPPRIQFLQPVYEILNQHTQEIELDPQGISYADRNRVDLTIDSIGDAAPEKKMYTVAKAVQDGASPLQIYQWLSFGDQGPRGTWFEWADLAIEQRQLPPEALDLLAAEGLGPNEFGDYELISVFLNNEMYGDGPFLNEILGWRQGQQFEIKLINLDRHTHYFRNVDFGTRLHDDIARCCGGGETSFEIMNFKPSYGAPKVAEMQWRAGWGFRPHYDVIQQDGVFSRGSDRARVKPYTGGEGGLYYGYQYSEEARGGDFRFDPPPFIIGEDANNPSSDRLKDADGLNGLVIGQFTEGYGTGGMCPQDPWPGFCTEDIAQYNPHGVINFPPPPLRGQPLLPADLDNPNFAGSDVYPDHAVELRFPPFLRNPSQGVEGAGDIIPPTGAWRPFLWTNPNNGSLFIDPDDPSKGHWADLTYSHGAPVLAGGVLDATVELPRASGQVFYQFDDLFHDNSIFSPHPLFEGDDEVDQIAHLNAFVRDFLRIRGRLTPLSDGSFASWVSLHAGAAGEDGCNGPMLETTPVRQSDGVFVFRCGTTERCSAPLKGQFDNFTLCVESTVGAFGDFTVVDAE